MRRLVRSWVAALLFVPGLAVAQPVDGFQTAVAVRAGSQTDPHISGTVISYTDYTDTDGNASAIHFYDLGVAGGNDTTIDPGAGYDLLSDISGNLIVYTHVESGTTRSIHVYNTTTHAVTVVDHQPGVDRRDAAIGGNTIAWVDYYSGASPEIYVYDLVTGPATGPVQISFSASEDTRPAVSPDGSTVVYSSCSGGFNGCDIVVYDTATNTSTVITGGATEDRFPDVSNDRVVYAESDASGDTDVVWVGLSGGASSGRFDAAGGQFYPSISGDLIAFVGFSPDNGGRDIYVLDITHNEIYRLTNTPESGEVLNDLSIGADGLIRVTWSTNDGFREDDVYAFTFSRRPPGGATLTLSPGVATNPVGTGHTVTATVTDAAAKSVEGFIVRFTVAGSVSASGACPTDAGGQCDFTYQGPDFPDADVITAYADANGSGTQDPGEPAAEATKTWVLPPSTSGQVNGAGQLRGASGEKITFGLHAKTTLGGPQGSCHFRRHLPGPDDEVECVNVSALVIIGNVATIHGSALHNGQSTLYQITARENDEPTPDAVTITTMSGFHAGGPLEHGKVDVKD